MWDPAQAHEGHEGQARRVLWAPAGRESHWAPAASAPSAAARGRARTLVRAPLPAVATPPVLFVPMRL